MGMCIWILIVRPYGLWRVFDGAYQVCINLSAQNKKVITFGSAGNKWEKSCVLEKALVGPRRSEFTWQTSRRALLCKRTPPKSLAPRHNKRGVNQSGSRCCEVLGCDRSEAWLRDRGPSSHSITQFLTQQGGMKDQSKSTATATTSEMSEENYQNTGGSEAETRLTYKTDFLLLPSVFPLAGIILYIRSCNGGSSYTEKSSNRIRKISTAPFLAGKTNMMEMHKAAGRRIS